MASRWACMTEAEPTGKTSILISQVVPQDDDYEHVLSLRCWCKPTMEAIAAPIVGLYGLQFSHRDADERSSDGS